MSLRAHLRRHGQSLIEVMAGFMVIIPLALFAVDVSVMAASSQTVNHLASEAARAAANQMSNGEALQAAQTALKNSSPAASIENFDYNEASGKVTVTIRLQVNLPVPVGSFTQATFSAGAVEPIVAQPAPN